MAKWGLPPFFVSVGVVVIAAGLATSPVQGTHVTGQVEPPAPYMPPIFLDVPGVPLLGGDDPPGDQPGLVLRDTMHFEYGHWDGIAKWYRVTNDEDPDDRYYVTTTRWVGRGTTTDHAYGHLSTDVYHLASGWAADGDTYFAGYAPTTMNACESTSAWTFTIGWPPSASYTWSEECQVASFGHQPYDVSSGGWDQPEYAVRATYEGMEGQEYGGTLEYGAAGVVPTGTTGYMSVLMIHESCWASSWANHYCTSDDGQYEDNTGWRSKPINWA